MNRLRSILVILVLVFTSGAHGSANADKEILGDWRYDGFLYRSHRYPNPNPKLNVTFTFQPDHTARLFWKRDDDSGFCERKGTWEIRDSILFQTVTWVNPDNDSGCARDPDMQLGQTQNKIAVQDLELDLYMTMNGSDFIYILIRPGSQSEPLQLLSQ